MASLFDLSGKIAVITGSTRGIGWECAKLLAVNGATVILNGVSDPDILNKRIVELTELAGHPANGYLCDVSAYDQVKAFYTWIFKEYKCLDILVNNAGVLDDSLIAMTSKEKIDRTININTKAVIYNIQYASRLMMRKKSGSIINISSIIGKYGNEGQIVYSASKAAVLGITYSASKELAPGNIRVNAIAPGFIQTDMVKQLTDEKYRILEKSIKMGRIGKPLDVANAVLFFSCDLSSYITGQVLGVDGGMVI
jgi:3-oxoacyl-[acyl-carrier protein] reductase